MSCSDCGALGKRSNADHHAASCHAAPSSAPLSPNTPHLSPMIPSLSPLVASALPTRPTTIDWPDGEIVCTTTYSVDRTGVASLASFTDQAGLNVYAGGLDGSITHFGPSGIVEDVFLGHSLSVWTICVDSIRPRLVSAGSDETIKVSHLISYSFRLSILPHIYKLDLGLGNRIKCFNLASPGKNLFNGPASFWRAIICVINGPNQNI